MAGASLWGFIFLVIIFEAIYRLRNKYSKGQIQTPQVTGKVESYSPEKIDEEVKKGRLLFVFDNLVLELKEDFIN